MRGINITYDEYMELLKSLDEFAYDYVKALEEDNNFEKIPSLSSLFTWKQTPQGHEYWRRLNDQLDDIIWSSIE